MLLGYYNGCVVNDNCMQQIFSWDFSFHKLGVASVVVLTIVGHNFSLLDKPKAYCRSRIFFKKGKKNLQLKCDTIKCLFYLLQRTNAVLLKYGDY